MSHYETFEELLFFCVFRPVSSVPRSLGSHGPLDIKTISQQSPTTLICSLQYQSSCLSQVRRIVDHPFVANCNPNIIHQPNISANKLYKMWAAAKAKWNTPHTNWKGESGNNQPWVSFCQGEEEKRVRELDVTGHLWASRYVLLAVAEAVVCSRSGCRRDSAVMARVLVMSLYQF